MYTHTFIIIIIIMSSLDFMLAAVASLRQERLTAFSDISHAVRGLLEVRWNRGKPHHVQQLTNSRSRI